MTWDEVCANPYLQDLPFEIETNRWGQIVMSPPAHDDQRFLQGSIKKLLRKKLRGGDVLQETAIDTESSFQRAPEICVEVKSPSNTIGELLEKKDLYLKAGAREVWIRERSGRILFFDAAGPLKKSRLCPGFPSTVKA